MYIGSFWPNKDRAGAKALYRKCVQQAREPVFYTAYGVPDTMDGRFEMICLHVSLLLGRLKQDSKNRRLCQTLFDEMFIDIDRSVREAGIGDLSVPKHIRRMMKAFRGRALAYEAALAGREDLGDVLRRNVFGTMQRVSAEAPAVMADYVRTCGRALERQAIKTLRGGEAVFPPPASPAHRKEKLYA
jgi:cytochrome b pre-mRNA-processing protein 3